MSAFQTLDDLTAAGQTVLVRGDLNVPMKDGRVSDTTRLARLVPTLDGLASAGARVVVLSHFGRPKGAADPALSLRPVAEALEPLIDRPVRFVGESVGPVARDAIAELPPGEILVLENVRFHAGEERNDPQLASDLASLGDVYVNDAFSAAHRAHASTEGMARLLPAYAGRLMQAELEALTAALERPARPVMALVGGAKISTKLELLGNLIDKVDQLVLGGGMANTFLAARGVEMGRSLVERDMLDQARAIAEKAEAKGCAIVLPVDGVIATALEPGVETETVPITRVPADRMVLDVGPESVTTLKHRIDQARTVVWNGPLGAFETPPFDRATADLARYVAERTEAGHLLSVAGGGDTVAALAACGVEGRFSYVSTAGGAFLEWLEGKTLPGVAALCGG